MSGSSWQSMFNSVKRGREGGTNGGMEGWRNGWMNRLDRGKKVRRKELSQHR